MYMYVCIFFNIVWEGGEGDCGYPLTGIDNSKVEIWKTVSEILGNTNNGNRSEWSPTNYVWLTKSDDWVAVVRFFQSRVSLLTELDDMEFSYKY